MLARAQPIFPPGSPQMRHLCRGAHATAKQFSSRAGIQTILDELAERNPNARQAKPQDSIDTAFIQQLDDSGYIDQRYARK